MTTYKSTLTSLYFHLKALQYKTKHSYHLNLVDYIYFTELNDMYENMYLSYIINTARRIYNHYMTHTIEI